MPHFLSSPPDLYASTGFTRFIKENNRWETDQFSRWVFSPGMLFNAGDKWWGDFKARTIPHEGIDLGLYRNGNDRLNALPPSTHIPAMYDGRIVKIMDDYLGKTIVMEHDPANEGGRLFLTLYGHTRPMEHLSVHQRIK